MNRPAYADDDTQPWYRQFWPWFLIALPATVVVMCMHLVYTAYNHADDLVVDEYYKVGLAINQQLERQQAARALGVEAKLMLTSGQVTVHIPEGAIRDPSLELVLSHPIEADRDFSVNLQRVGPGVYHGMLISPVAERWHWTLRDGVAGTWRIDGVVAAADLLQQGTQSTP